MEGRIVILSLSIVILSLSIVILSLSKDDDVMLRLSKHSSFDSASLRSG